MTLVWPLLEDAGCIWKEVIWENGETALGFNWSSFPFWEIEVILGTWAIEACFEI